MTEGEERGRSFASRKGPISGTLRLGASGSVDFHMGQSKLGTRPGAAQQLEARQAEQKKAEQKLDGWSSTAGPAFGRTSPQRSQRRVITPPWISAAGTSPRWPPC